MGVPTDGVGQVPLRLITDYLPVLVGYVDAGQRYRFNNRAYAEWLGTDVSAITGRTMPEALGEEAYSKLQPFVARALRGETVEFEVEVPYRTHLRRVRGLYVPHRDVSGTVEGFAILISDVTAYHAALRAAEEQRAAAEAAEKRYRFLAEAGELLGSSLDYDVTIAAVLRLTVPQLADWTGVDLIEGGRIERLALAVADPDQEAVAWDLTRRYPENLEGDGALAQVLRTGQPVLYPEVGDELLAASAQDPEHLRLLREIALRSAMIVPLNVRGRTLGALWLATTRSRRVYGQEDLQLAQRLGDRAAVAIDNARLYRVARRKA